MSAAQNVKQHPALIQAQNKANYYVGQLDKEVSRHRHRLEIASHDPDLPASCPNTLP